MKLSLNSYQLRLEKIATIALIGTCLLAAWGEFTQAARSVEGVWVPAEIGIWVLSGIICVRLFPKGIWKLTFFYALVAAIESPLVAFHFKDANPGIIHLASAAAFGWLLCQLHLISKVMTRERVQKLQLAEARADAINEAIQKGDLDAGKLEHFVQKLPGNAPDFPKISISSPGSDSSTTESNRRDETIHFVLKYPPPGVPRTAESTLITAKASRVFDLDGNQSYKVSLFAKSDPLTVFEASSAVYWRDRIQQGAITDAFVIEWMHAIGQLTIRRYIPASSIDSHPGEVAITSGLTQLSLHYTIAYLDALPLPQATKDWLASRQTKGLSYDRKIDCERADSLKKALAASAIPSDFLSHVRRSVVGSRE